MVANLAIALHQGPREIEQLTWWDFQDFNDAFKERAETINRKTHRKPGVGDLAQFGGGILERLPDVNG